MKKTFLAALGVASLAIASFPVASMAASAPDFSGTWVRDNAKSTPVSFPTYFLTRGVSSGGGGGGETVIEVRQTGASLQVTDPAHALRTLTLDGRTYTVPMETGIQNQTVTAAVQGASVVVTTRHPFAGLPGNVDTTTRETWTLSPDGRVLTVATVRSLPATTQNFTEVYTKR